MSQEEQAQSIGQLVIAYIESKRKLATLGAEISRLSEACLRAGEALRDRADDPAVSNSCIGLPESTKLNSLLAEFHSEQERHADFLQRIKGVGLEG
jgi:hypothetical protein